MSKISTLLNSKPTSETNLKHENKMPEVVKTFGIGVEDMPYDLVFNKEQRRRFIHNQILSLTDVIHELTHGDIDIVVQSIKCETFGYKIALTNTHIATVYQFVNAKNYAIEMSKYRFNGSCNVKVESYSGEKGLMESSVLIDIVSVY